MLIIVILLALLIIILYLVLSPLVLTRGYVALLVKDKGSQNITWEDFEKFPHEKVDSELLIYKYKLRDGGHLFIGGIDLNQPPIYVYIKNTDGSEIDIMLRL